MEYELPRRVESFEGTVRARSRPECSKHAMRPAFNHPDPPLLPLAFSPPSVRQMTWKQMLLREMTPDRLVEVLDIDWVQARPARKVTPDRLHDLGREEVRRRSCSFFKEADDLRT